MGKTKRDFASPLAIDDEAVQAAVDRLHAWFGGNQRTMPWRATRDPYAIWVSEVMLQQTQVVTVIPYFERWMVRLPTLAALAAVESAEVLKLWQGLGYYRRARSLHRAAVALVAAGYEKVPPDPKLFESLPGVGPYTVAAVMSIAYGLDLAALDGNVRRVVARLGAVEVPVDRPPGAAVAQEWVARLFRFGQAALHNQAMMELGALVCTPRAPKCALCPLVAICAAQRLGAPERFPVRRIRAKVPVVEFVTLLACHGGRIYLRQRPYDGLLGGLWELPAWRLDPGADRVVVVGERAQRELGLRLRLVAPLPPTRHAYSHFKVVLHPWLGAVEGTATSAGDTPSAWVRPEEREDFPMHRGSEKVLQAWLRSGGACEARDKGQDQVEVYPWERSRGQ